MAGADQVTTLWFVHSMADESWRSRPDRPNAPCRHLKDLSALAESAGNYKVILDGSRPPAVPRMNDGFENFEVSFWHIFW